MDKLSNISVEGIGWCQFNDHLISFGSSQKYPDIHFTISYNENSPDINFHVTKEISSGENARLHIIKINKDALEYNLPRLWQIFFHRFYEEVNIADSQFTTGNSETFFMNISNEEDERVFDSIYSIIIKSPADYFKLTRNNSRLKINQALLFEIFSDDGINKISEVWKKYIDELEDNRGDESNMGLLITENEILRIVKVDKKWYRQIKKIGLLDMIYCFTDENSAQRLITHYNNCLSHIVACNTKEEIEKFNNPLRYKLPLPPALQTTS